MLWLVVVALVGPWIVWHLARQLYSAAMHDYILTGIPEVRVYRQQNPRIFRNNVVATIIGFPIVTAGAVSLLLDALQAQHLIQ